MLSCCDNAQQLRCKAVLSQYDLQIGVTGPVQQLM